jgi:Xaa-Pro aminopeptidase
MFSRDTFINRRKSLLDLMISKGAQGHIVLVGNSYVPYNYKANYHLFFKQDSTFRYFFGLNEPDLIGVISLETGKAFIAGKDPDLEDIVWSGKPEKSLPDRADALAGITEITDTLSSKILEGKIHSIAPYRFPSIITDKDVSIDLIKSIVALRSIKSEEEIAHMTEIQKVSCEMFNVAEDLASKNAAPFSIYSAMQEIALRNRGNFSFPPIISTEGQILHNPNFYSTERPGKGKLYLIDAGFDSEHGYTTDQTRVFLIVGNNTMDRKESDWTTCQRNINWIVLDAYQKILNTASPDFNYFEMHMLAVREIVEGLKGINIMRGDIDSIIQSGAYTTFFPHGLGHMMGMDVHDMENLGEDYVGYDNSTKRSTQFGLKYLRMARKLEPGMVVTNEPGIYFIPALIEQSKQNFKSFINYNEVEKYMSVKGIRIEDDILITQNGNQNLGLYS